MSSLVASLLLSLLILLNREHAKTGAQGQKAGIGVNIRMVSLEETLVVTCKGPFSLGMLSCNLYRNSEGSPYRTAQSAVNGCTFSVTGKDLLGGQMPTERYSDVRVSCDFGREEHTPLQRSDEITVTVHKGTQIKARLTVNPTVVRITDSVTLQCEGPQSESLSGSRCFFYSANKNLNEVPLECQKSFAGDQLIDGSLGADKRVHLQCSFTVEGHQKSQLSAPVSVTVLGLTKPSISVSRTESQVQILCEAPSHITAAVLFFLYEDGKTYIATKEAAAGKRSASFQVLYNSTSVRYCCTYQYKRTNSAPSDCVGEQHAQAGRMQIAVGVATAVGVSLLAVTAVCLCVRRRKAAPARNSRRAAGAPSKDPTEPAAGSTGQGTHGDDDDDGPTCDVTYSAIDHQDSASKESARCIEDDVIVVYSSVNTH